MDVSIIGAGYVGLVTGACLAEAGHRVTCVDQDPRKVDAINRGESPIHEEGLPALLRRHAGGNLRATTSLRPAIADSQISFIAVGTPSKDGHIDLRAVERAASGIGAELRRKDGWHTVVVKSTVIPGTTEGTVRRHLEAFSGRSAGGGFGLGMNPEFLTEGCAVRDFTHPDRLVFGALDVRTHGVLSELYEDIDAAVPRLCTSTSTAEMIKYASNAVLATLISYSNEIARLCSAVGVDAAQVLDGVRASAYLTQRDGGRARTAPIGAFVEAGCGFGGSCLPKDVTALVGQGAALGVPMPLLSSVLEVNRGQTAEMMRMLRREVPDLSGVPVTVLGLAFKPDTGDTRESPAFPLIRQLRDAGADVTLYDPVARPDGEPELQGVEFAPNFTEAVRGAEVVMLVTRWSEFQQLPAVLATLRRDPLVVDGRRVLNPGDYVRYCGIGR